MPNIRFIYDEESSGLYAPDGTFLKRVYCPKSLNWNQLIVEDDEERWRMCETCKERVVNLDVADVREVIENFRYSWGHTCVYASSTSDKVIFLRDKNAPPQATAAKPDATGLIVIKTARSIEDINRAVGLGYWPDVRFIEYDKEKLSSKLSIGQNKHTGRIEASGDYRRTYYVPGGSSIRDQNDPDETWIEALPFRTFYQYYQQVPVAAYLIPRDTPNGTLVMVEDPIEDIVGWEWNQGNAERAENVQGRIEGHRVVLDKKSISVTHAVG
jgi:hypothetical protein